MKPILKKVILPAGQRVPEELKPFERADEFEIKQFRTREELGT